MPDVCLGIMHNSIPHPLNQEPHPDIVLHPSDNVSSETEAYSKNVCIDREHPPVWSRIYGTPHLDNYLAGRHICTEYCDILENDINLWSWLNCEEAYRIAHK